MKRLEDRFKILGSESSGLAEFTYSPLLTEQSVRDLIQKLAKYTTINEDISEKVSEYKLGQEEKSATVPLNSVIPNSVTTSYVLRDGGLSITLSSAKEQTYRGAKGIIGPGGMSRYKEGIEVCITLEAASDGENEKRFDNIKKTIEETYNPLLAAIEREKFT